MTYRPNVETLRKVIASLSSGVEKVFIFDNSEHSFNTDGLFHGSSMQMQFIYNAENIGIAAAQNRLLDESLVEGFDLAILSDQDTIYPEGYALNLQGYCFAKENVAAVCPGWLDINLQSDANYPGQYIFDSSNRLKLDRSEPEFLEISHAISSGMIINLHNLRRVGLMRDDLFIDWVDNEWCWRARASGCVVLAIPAVKVSHTLGDSTIKIFGKNFVKRSKERNYYIIRNALYLALYSRTPLAAKTYLLKKVIHHSVFSLIASQDKLAELYCLIKAWLHGLGAKLGKIS